MKLVAQSYIDAGWAVVPLSAGTKAGKGNWQKTKYEAAQFRSDDGIAGKCGEPSGWRVDMDLDYAEAVQAGKLLLPHTGLIHGRPGKPESHHWFLCEGAKTKQFRDTKANGNKMIVEIRSTGGYTVLPPSIHPSGEQFTWSHDRDPLVMDYDPLLEVGTDVAITAFVLHHWAELTHTGMGHLAGFLLQHGVSDQRLLRLYKTVGTLAPGNHAGEILSFAQATVGKFLAGEKVTGGPKLVEDLGEDGVATLRRWLNVQDTDALEHLNTVHFFVRMGSKSVIGREDDPSGVVFQPSGELYDEYANRKVFIKNKKGDLESKGLFPAWMEYEQRRSFRSVVFKPPPLIADPQDYNLWRGYACEPEEGDVMPYLEHLREVICDGDAVRYEFLLNVLAKTVQQPGLPTGIATVLRGGQGAGKGAAIRPIGALFDRRHFAHLDKVDQFAGRFNAAGVSGKIILFADEGFWAGDKREIGTLKRIITEPTLLVERKNLEATHEDNHVHLFMATNNEWSWPAGLDDRRGFLLKVSDKHAGNEKYFKRLWAVPASALLYFFLSVPVDEQMLKSTLKTDELRTQQVHSLEGPMKWWHECLFDGQIGLMGWPPGWVPSTKIYQAYQNWASSFKGRVLTSIEFGMSVRGFLSAGPSEVRHVPGEGKVRCMNLRSLKEARVYFDVKLKTHEDWPTIEDDPSQTIF